jgi:cold shock CspA family protein
MQGTVKHYDDDARTGSAVTDDRMEVGIDGRSFADDMILTLRLGQRVSFEIVEEEGSPPLARGLRLVTF